MGGGGGGYSVLLIAQLGEATPVLFILPWLGEACPLLLAGSFTCPPVYLVGERGGKSFQDRGLCHQFLSKVHEEGHV